MFFINFLLLFALASRTEGVSSESFTYALVLCVKSCFAESASHFQRIWAVNTKLKL
ncbi:MAG: hypothetical protein NZ551_09975 [Microscillaceae bacterium]|nr:hypothetical protein [Microscillaceae bacterium]MDW8461523.1 hypothetical protein [Cytophagales bacterium]